MTYDYYVADIKNADFTAPNQPLHTVDCPECSKRWSVEESVKAYEQGGATKSKMKLGIAFYAHSWYVPGL